MVHRLTVLALLAVVLPLAACVSDDISLATTYDPLYPFPQASTYAWNDAANKLPDKKIFREMKIDSLLKEVANEEFSKRGYRPVSSGNAAYRLSYEVSVATWIGGTENTHSISSFSILLVDAKTSRRVWLGWGEAEVLIGLTDEERKSRIQDAFEYMLAKFPPAQRGE